MSIETEMRVISMELTTIEEAQERIKSYAEELNKYNPFSVGEELIGNDWSHIGKPFIVDTVFVANQSNDPIGFNSGYQVTYFTAHGYVKKKDGSLSCYTTTRNISINKLLEEK